MMLTMLILALYAWWRRRARRRGADHGNQATLDSLDPRTRRDIGLDGADGGPR
jgi:uncharacterized iron-regulated membrane protein